MIVTLCGSVKFESDFHVASLELGRRAIICFTLVAFPSITEGVSFSGQPLEESSYDKIMLDLGYFHKIVKSDAVLVVGSGYIGKSTSREILWARMMGKPVVHQLSHDWDSIVNRLQSNQTDKHLIQKAMLVLKGDVP
jgi:hypothetical protein